MSTSDHHELMIGQTHSQQTERRCVKSILASITQALSMFNYILEQNKPKNLFILRDKYSILVFQKY